MRSCEMNSRLFAHAADCYIGGPTYEGSMSRTKSTLLCILMIVSLFSVSPFGVGAESTETVIDSQVEWVDDRLLEGDVRIVSGGELTVNGLTLTIADGASVIVDEGGILNVRNSAVESENPPSGLIGYGYWDEVNRSAVLIPGSDYGVGFSATFHAPEGHSFYGGQAIVDGMEPVDTNGSEFTLEFNETVEDVWVGLVAYGHQAVRLASVTLTPEVGSEATHEAIDLENRNMMALDTDEGSCVIDIDGSSDISDSSMLGCDVVVNGSLTIHSSALERTGPVFVNADGEIVLSGSTSFSMSSDDHDVRVHAKATLHWGDNVIGSGGHTDRWERVMGPQIIQFDAVGVLFRILEFGPLETTSSTFFSDQNGIGLIDSGEPRTVEIGWADGGVWTESARIEIIEYRTGWNMDGDLPDYGGDIIPLTWDEVIVIDDGTPNIDFISIEYSQPTESVSRSSGGVGLIATIANRGTAPAVVYFDCDVAENGLAAQITSYPGGLIEAGEEVGIQFSWMNSDEDLASLSCEILTPSQLVEEDAFGGGTASSAQITWYDAEDEEGSIIPIIAAIFIAIVAMSGFFMRMMKRNSDEDEDILY